MEKSTCLIDEILTGSTSHHIPGDLSLPGNMAFMDKSDLFIILTPSFTTIDRGAGAEQTTIEYGGYLCESDALNPNNFAELMSFNCIGHSEKILYSICKALFFNKNSQVKIYF